MLNFKTNIWINYRNYLKKIFPKTICYIVNGDLFIKIPYIKLIKFLKFLKNHTQCQYKILSDICAIDYPWKKNRFELLYNFLSILYNSRVCVILCINEKNFVKSITSIYKAAGWFEREIWDLFGIYFIQNKDLRRILTDYGFKGYPLRKDFPLTGYTEVRYIDSEKRVLIEEVTLSQDFRNFFFKNTWNKLI